MLSNSLPGATTAPAIADQVFSSMTALLADSAAPARPGGVGGWLLSANDWAAYLVTALAAWRGPTSTAGQALLGVCGGGLLTGALMLAAAGAGRVLERYHRAQRAVWVEITPPPAMPSEGGLAMWRMLAGCLRRARRGFPAPVLAVEWFADPAGVRAGIWVPASISAGQVADALTRAWPGTRVTRTHPPVWHYTPTLIELTPTRGRWSPLIDPTPSRSPRSSGEEPLRAVLDALARRGPGEQASVQLVITEATGLRAWLARTLPANRSRGGRGLVGGVLGLVRAAAPTLLGTLAGALAAAIVGLLDILGPGPFSSGKPTTSRASASSRTGSTGFGGFEHRTVDPGLAADRRAGEIKRATARLHATLRVAVATARVEPASSRRGRRKREGRRGVAATATAAIAAGFDLATTHTPLRARPARCAEPIYLRTPGDGFPVTLAELAALWHLPAQPLLYRIAAPTAGDRGPGLGHSRIVPSTRRPNTPNTPPTNPPLSSTPPSGPEAGGPRGSAQPARRDAGTRPGRPLGPARRPTRIHHQPGGQLSDLHGDQRGDQRGRRGERGHGGGWR
jgi:hypothetical protein